MADLERYDVLLYARAYRDLDEIYGYIAEQLQAPGAALNLVDEIEEAIASLETLPHRGAIRRIGAFANQGYRQLRVKHFVIIYRVIEKSRQVHIVTVRYGRSEF